MWLALQWGDLGERPAGLDLPAGPAQPELAQDEHDSTPAARTPVLAPTPAEEQPEPDKLAAEVAPPGEAASSPVVGIVAAHFGLSPEVAEAEIREAWPALLESEVDPLEDWETLEPDVANYIIDTFWGRDEGRVRMHQLMVLGKPLLAYCEKELPIDASEELVQEVADQVEALLQRDFRTFDDLAEEGARLVRIKVQQEDYDRFPYLTLGSQRQRTGLEGQQALYNMSGSPRGCWIINFDIYRNESAALAMQYDAYAELRRSLRSEVASLVARYR